MESRQNMTDEIKWLLSQGFGVAFGVGMWWQNYRLTNRYIDQSRQVVEEMAANRGAIEALTELVKKCTIHRL